MFIICILEFLMILPSYLALNADSSEIIDKILNLVVTAVPPALPLALTMSINMSVKRLRSNKNQIFTTSPNKIIVCGLLDTICFDKTGTLTQNDLNIYKVYNYENNNINEFNDTMNIQNYNIIKCMAVCNSNVIIDDKLQGDPLDIEFYKYSKYSLENN